MLLMYKARRKDTFLNQLRIDRAIASGARWHLFKSGPFATNGSAAVVFLRSQQHLERPDVQLVCSSVANDASTLVSRLDPPPVHSFTARVGTLYPHSRGWLKLRSADPTDRPRIFFNLFGERADVDDMIRALRIAREIYNTAPQKDLIGEEMTPGEGAKTDAELEQAIRQLGHNRQHPVGTCAMGVGPQAVVNRREPKHWEIRTNLQGLAHFPSIPQGKVRVQVIAKDYQTFGESFDVDEEQKTIEVTIKPPQKQYSVYGAHSDSTEPK